jgi:hypothetical protein
VASIHLPIRRLRCENGRDLSRCSRYRDTHACCLRISEICRQGFVAEVHFWRHYCQAGQCRATCGRTLSRSARNGSAKSTRCGVVTRQVDCQRALVGSGETAAKPLLHSLLAPRCSQLPYIYARLYLWFNLRESRAPKTSGQIQKVFGGASRCGVRRSRFERAANLARGWWVAF